ncbi:MAG: hypothetical protein Q9160_005787 [Pyrenula sp. 1 TL-2023]
MPPAKGLGASERYDGSGLRIAILHARWNTPIISALVTGCKNRLLANGVKEENIVIDSVPGSWELPGATQKLYTASQLQSSRIASATSGLLSSATDLLSSTSITDLPSSASTTKSPPPPLTSTSKADAKAEAKAEAKADPLPQPFDAIIPIGVLIKGETMHFEYIADAVSHGLMKVQLESGVPVVFGVLTVLSEAQGFARAGLDAKGEEGGEGAHNHGVDWADAAVEVGVKGRGWKEGVLG